MTEEMLKYIKVIEEIDDLIVRHFWSLNELLNSSELKNISKKYYQNREEHKNSGFNIFNLISDKYYYENFHSDIIATFLNPNGEHQEGNKFLKILIELLQKLKPDLAIEIDDFSNASTLRENHRIDILIQDHETEKVVIIENKIKNAWDTYRQLPTYVSEMGMENVAAIIYLPLDPNKVPDKTDWTEEEISFIDSKLICLPAYNRTENDLYSGWLQRCINEAGNDDVKTILKQYSKLIQKLGGLIMDKNLFSKFYDKALSERDFFKSSLSVKEFVDNLPNYRIEKIVDTFIGNPKPFYQLRKMSNTMARFEGFEIENSKYAIDIVAEIDKYKLQFWDTNYKEGDNPAKYKLQNLGLLDDFYEVDYWYEKLFAFPSEETKIYDYIKMIMNKLK
ncbi:hypothetical protein ES705_27570 [subsurface metagenome]